MASVETKMGQRIMATEQATAGRQSVPAAGGLHVETQFCPVHVGDPFETVTWEKRTAAIKCEAGGLLFEQHDCDVPSDWSQLATNVVVSKYFY